jgi:hypothetical protein
MFGRGVLLKGKDFHSIVIVVPLHVSKFYRVLKKLTAYPGESIESLRSQFPGETIKSEICFIQKKANRQPLRKPLNSI